MQADALDTFDEKYQQAKAEYLARALNGALRQKDTKQLVKLLGKAIRTESIPRLRERMADRISYTAINGICQGSDPRLSTTLRILQALGLGLQVVIENPPENPVKNPAPEIPESVREG